MPEYPLLTPPALLCSVLLATVALSERVVLATSAAVPSVGGMPLLSCLLRLEFVAAVGCAGAEGHCNAMQDLLRASLSEAWREIGGERRGDGGCVRQECQKQRVMKGQLALGCWSAPPGQGLQCGEWN